MIQFPKYIQIETTVLCNAECTFCPNDKLLRGPRDMEERIWKKIIDDSRGRGVIYRPFLVNEPLVDRRLPSIMKYIKQDPTARIDLNSNAISLTEKLSRELIGAGLDLIKFSVDGFSPESWEASGRGNRNKYRRVVENIIGFINIKNELKHHCEVFVRMIDLPANKGDQGPFLEFWNEKGALAQIVPLYSWPWTGQKNAYLKPCPKIRQEMFFYVDGRATLCCWDNWERGVIGDIRYASVEEIWQGGLNRHFRGLLNDGKRNEILLCSRCDAYESFDFGGWAGY